MEEDVTILGLARDGQQFGEFIAYLLQERKVDCLGAQGPICS